MHYFKRIDAIRAEKTYERSDNDKKKYSI